MTGLKNLNADKLAQEVFFSLDATNKMVGQLLNDLRAKDVDFARIRSDLNNVVEKVKELTDLVRESEEGQVGTSIETALLKRAVQELENKVKELDQRFKEERSADKTGQWQVTTVVITGILGLITAIITILLNFVFK